ncbi:MAG: putative LPS assembly protein LptD [Bacteroidales bacterium]|nr:putative LPS assembly protein LptD [Bacteroidales bacterium]
MRTTIFLLFSFVVALSLATSRTVATRLTATILATEDSVRQDSLVPDSAVRDAVVALRNAVEPLRDAVAPDSVGTDSAAVPDSAAVGAGVAVAMDEMPLDSAVVDTVATDSVKKKKPGLDAPVEYESVDSLVFDGETGLAYLYGKAKVNYQNMQLDAAKITMNMDSSLVHAEGYRDTANVLIDAPIYTQGSDTYNSEKMSFNFKTKKGYISNVSTTQGNGFLDSESSKRTDDGTFYLQHAKYTTCDAKHPHFYLALSRAKVLPGKETIFGPAYLVVEDVPLPLAIPYGFFPFNKKYSSGIIMPTYGDETTRGFYLRDGGYYFAVNDFVDFTVLGEVYTKGSWGLSFETNYTKRYKYNGNFYVSYLRTVEGEKNMPDYAVTKSLKVQWTHSKTSTASSNTTFSARVNFASENYERSNLASLYNAMTYSQSTRTSSVSFSHTFDRIGLTISGSSNLTQSLADSSIDVTLPDLTISLSRVYPFKRKVMVGSEKWYEKISLTYTGIFSNSISTTESRLFKSNLIKDWRNGMRHSIPIQATFQLFKHINITPQISIRDYMYTNRVMRSWDTEAQQEVLDTTYGFYNLYDWSTSLSANTTLYGFYKPWKKVFGDKIIAIRHVFKPALSFSYSPDFTTSSYGYVKTYVKTDANGEVSTVSYSPYSNALYGYPSGTKSGTVTMSVSNNVEMKVKSDRDSTGEKKISIIDELYGSLSYNLAAQTRPWSNLSTRVRLKLTKNYTFSLSAVFATYAYAFDENGNVVTSDRTEWSYGRFGRFQGMSQNLSYTFNNQTFKKLFSRDKKSETAPTDGPEDMEEIVTEDANMDPDQVASKNQGAKIKSKKRVDDDGYLAFSIPWSFTVSYGITMREDTSREINVRRMRYPYSFSQTMNFSGYIRIADGWNITFASGYDFEDHELTTTTATLSRDLHCFEMSCSMVLRPYSSFNFSFRATASELADALKWDKRSSYSSNIEWY